MRTYYNDETKQALQEIFFAHPYQTLMNAESLLESVGSMPPATTTQGRSAANVTMAINLLVTGRPASVSAVYVYAK